MLPLGRPALERVIRTKQNKRKRALNEDEWALLRHVHDTHQAGDEGDYDRLIQNRLVSEYIENDESWLKINPLLFEAQEMERT